MNSHLDTTLIRVHNVNGVLAEMKSDSTCARKQTTTWTEGHLAIHRESVCEIEAEVGRGQNWQEGSRVSPGHSIRGQPFSSQLRSRQG